ncbi:MAG: MBL fold metallo-hydrolase [Eubacteriales bacterium]|nr:MBL fold metallo-hydrolase [Eubacteriales bacterium]
MNITALVENKSDGNFNPKHGLSLYIETEEHKILFDLGPDGTLFENSRKAGIDLRHVDTVIISHGHSDHGGALKQFLEINHKAKVYVQRKAFEKHYSKFLFLKVNVGLDKKLAGHEQIVLVDGDYKIDEKLFLFTVKSSPKYYSTVNDALYTVNGKDDFTHEQNLIISGEKNVLIMGCGHSGVATILGETEKYHPEVCIGGYHLFNPISKKGVSDSLLEQIAKDMSRYDIKFYTCHCTGEYAYQYLEKHLCEMHYLSCGTTISI